MIGIAMYLRRVVRCLRARHAAGSAIDELDHSLHRFRDGVDREAVAVDEVQQRRRRERDAHDDLRASIGEVISRMEGGGADGIGGR